MSDNKSALPASNVCRSCLSSGLEMHPLNCRLLAGDSRTLSEILCFVADISVDHDDNLPMQLCNKCLNAVHVADLFKRKCQKSQETFKVFPFDYGKNGNNKNDENISCEDCRWSFDDISEMDYHMKCHINPYQCSLCLLRFSNCNTLEFHLYVVHNQNNEKSTKLECDNCELILTSRDTYETHITNCLKTEVPAPVDDNNADDTYFSDDDAPIAAIARERCKIEDEVLLNNDMNNERAGKISLSLKVYCCSECDIKFDSKKSYKAHAKSLHSSTDELASVKKPKKRKLNTNILLNGTINDKHKQLEICLSKIPEREDKKTDELKSNVKIEYIGRYDNGSQLESNEQVKSNFVSYSCTMCERKFRKKLSLEEHLKKHETLEMETHVCTICKREYKHRAHLNNHVLSMHSSDEGLKCDICQKSFAHQDSLELHLLSHSGQKKHKCDLCEKAFTMLSTLKDHLRIHSGEKPFLCSTCGRGFSQKTNLKEHMRRHLGHKPFKCDACDQSFVSKGELVAHKRKHSGAHPFVCNSCGSGFTTSSSLVKHRRIHTGERPYMCDLCPMKFTALGTLKNHKRTHTGEKPYKCTFCDKAFAQKTDLVSHTRCHTGERPYACVTCGQSFRQGSALKTHRKMHLAKENAEQATQATKKVTFMPSLFNLQGMTPLGMLPPSSSDTSTSETPQSLDPSDTNYKNG